MGTSSASRERHRHGQAREVRNCFSWLMLRWGWTAWGKRGINGRPSHRVVIVVPAVTLVNLSRQKVTSAFCSRRDHKKNFTAVRVLLPCKWSRIGVLTATERAITACGIWFRTRTLRYRRARSFALINQCFGEIKHRDRGTKSLNRNRMPQTDIRRKLRHNSFFFCR